MTSKTCQPGNIGAFCQSSADCFLGKGFEEGIRCIDSKCFKPMYNGYPCKKNEECFGNKCLDHICKGFMLNESCDPNKEVQCDSGLFCSFLTKTCMNQRKYNETCGEHLENENLDPNLRPEGTDFNVICQAGSICKGIHIPKKCEPYRQGKVNEPCNYEIDGSMGCRFGLSCDPKQGRCVNNNPGSRTECPGSGGSFCRTNEVCACKNSSDEHPNSRCIQVSGSNNNCQFYNSAQSWLDCSIANQCPLDTRKIIDEWIVDLFSPESCRGKYCANIPKDTLCCMFHDQVYNPYSEFQLGELAKFCVYPGIGSSVFLIVLLLIILFFTTLIIVFLVALYRRSHPITKGNINARENGDEILIGGATGSYERLK